MSSWRTWRALGFLLIFLLIFLSIAAYITASREEWGTDWPRSHQVAGIIREAMGEAAGAVRSAAEDARTPQGSLALVKEQTAPLEGIRRLEVLVSSDDVRVSFTEDIVQLSVKWRGDSSIRPEEAFTLHQTGDTITIRQPERPPFVGWGWNVGSYLEIQLPTTYREGMSLASSSGDIELSGDAALTKAEFKLSSGDFRLLGKLIAEDVSIHSSSGDLRLDGSIESKGLQVQSTSGGIRIHALYTGTYQVNTSSGDIEVNIHTGQGRIQATSGDITAKLEAEAGDIDMKSSSGDAQVWLHPSIAFELEAACSSGEIRTNFSVTTEGTRKNRAHATVGDAPYKKIQVNTTSGDIGVTRGG